MDARSGSAESVSVVGICGSLRKGSYARMAVRIALEGAEEMGARTQLVDLADFKLIFCDGKEDESQYPEDVFRLRREVGAVQGIVLGTPEYHGSYSGVLKNALDLMGFDEIEGKMMGLVGVSGGRMGAFEGMNGLRAIGRALHAWVIPEQAAIPQAWKEFDENGKLKDDGLRERVLEVGRQVARFAYLHTSEKAQEFLAEWIGAVANPGGGRAT